MNQETLNQLAQLPVDEQEAIAKLVTEKLDGLVENTANEYKQDKENQRQAQLEADYNRELREITNAHVTDHSYRVKLITEMQERYMALGYRGAF